MCDLDKECLMVTVTDSIHNCVIILKHNYLLILTGGLAVSRSQAEPQLLSATVGERIAFCVVIISIVVDFVLALADVAV